MYLLLTDFCSITQLHILESDEKCINFLQDLELIPRKTDQQNCPKCGSKMKTLREKRKKPGWIWQCSIKTCRGSLSPLKNTFFWMTRLPIRYILAVIIYFVEQREFGETYSMLSSRKSRGDPALCRQTVYRILSRCKEVCEIYVSRNYNEPVDLTSNSTDQILVSQQNAVRMYMERRLPENLRENERLINFLQDIKDIFPGPGKEGEGFLESEMATSSAALEDTQSSPAELKDTQSSPATLEDTQPSPAALENSTLSAVFSKTSAFDFNMPLDLSFRRNF